MKDKNWMESMEELGNIRLFCSLHLKKARKGALTSAQEVDMLFRIALSVHPMTPLELSHEMGISKTIISHLIENMNSRGLIEKGHNQEDKRSYFLKITEKGKEELDSMYYYYLNPLYALKENLGKKDYRQLITLINAANTAMIASQSTAKQASSK